MNRRLFEGYTNGGTDVAVTVADHTTSTVVLDQVLEQHKQMFTGPIKPTDITANETLKNIDNDDRVYQNGDANLGSNDDEVIFPVPKDLSKSIPPNGVIIKSNHPSLSSDILSPTNVAPPSISSNQNPIDEAVYTFDQLAQNESESVSY